ncbi:MAG TPA: GatB/YqeY domain-containing protein [Verrucomicrobiae bacterium]|jgi:uncharacterized protein YqeY|nr:GatB/YqeY domain-containing protein [Verrucomicrobiae bacterium]
MGLETTIEQDLISAMKAKDADKLMVLRMLKTAIMNSKIQKKKEDLDENEILEVIQKQAKQRQESMDSYKSAGRQDLFAKEEKEYAILKTYLPAQLSDEEIKALVQKAMASTGAKTKADTGRLMKELMPAVKGKADGKRVNEIVSSLLS